MRLRSVLIGSAALLAAAGSVSPALAGPTGGAATGSWTFSATPNPTGDTPAQAGGKGKCMPTGGVGRATQEFTIPGPGTLDVALNNKLDWSADIRTKDGEVVADSDGGKPNDPEIMSASFKKKTTITVGACNLEGEPSVTATYTFTPKHK